MPKCALCGKEVELELSHIVPKFVFRNLKKVSPTGKIRLASEPNKNVQDGEKMYLLCGKCEDLFNEYETTFSRVIFYNFLSGKQTEFKYGEWLPRYIISVSWRILYLDIIDFVREKNIDVHDLNILIQSERLMKEYLLKKRTDLGKIENHILFTDEVVGKSGAAEEWDLNTLLGSVFGYTVICDNSSYVFLNLRGIIMVTILKKDPRENWLRTLIKLEGGEIFIGNQSSKSPVFNELGYLAEELKKSREKLSAKNKQRILNAIKNDPVKFINSESYRRMMADRG